ncbi:hypothetical protein AK812_SmicGene26725 [Symbiodinium microadriaticum]|uniref:Uncharacterized protein n=1 Tax=Symbiodinium microadriaticum TaxID=2951 RepID=A0A1Q9D8U7_SYMMI|nr:hypothetical protein AK812_SmicGene26725 [Symbiodinium microadriaticum]
MSRLLLGVLPVLFSAWAEDPQGTPQPLHIYAEFGARATSIQPAIFETGEGNGDCCYDDDVRAGGEAREEAQQQSRLEIAFTPATPPVEDYPHDYSEVNDYTWLMQNIDDDKAWRSFLQHVRSKLETVNKIELAMITDGLLRRLDWHGTNRAAGYLLGHMGDRTGELTSLLVAFRDEMEVDCEIYEPPEVEGIWNEVQHFIPAHPGSDRRQGKRLSHEPPCIMMTMHEVPSEFLTPGRTPSRNTSRQASPRQRRQKYLKVELAMEGSEGRGRSSVVLPLVNNKAQLSLRFTTTDRNVSEDEATVAAETSTGSAGVALPPSAPGVLGEAGLSLQDLRELHRKWSLGTMSMGEIERCHGPTVAQELRARWDTPQGSGTLADNEETIEHKVGATTENSGENDMTKDTEPEESNLLTTGMSITFALTLTPNTQGMDNEVDVMELLREHLHRQRGEGTTAREQASTLYYLMESRGNQHYMQEFPEIAEQLGLEVDVDVSSRCMPGPTPFFVWMEAEVWANFIDQVEGMMGFETEIVQRNRATPTMSDEEMEAWRRWASTRGTSRHRELRIRERVTRETRNLGRECAASSWQSWQPEPEEPAGHGAGPASGTGEMDILEATGRWFVIMGLRPPGQESTEPSNALTRRMQAEARTTLRSLSERDLSVMVTALLRLTGMIYIESARLLTQARDDRRRSTEEVEVEVEADDDDESIYMQRFTKTRPGVRWEESLQELLRLADSGGEVHRGLLRGLQRRIRDSLYLQTERGAQLQAALVVAVSSLEESLLDACETEENDANLLEEWWARLKKMMDLGKDDSQASASDDVVAVPASTPLADPGHRAQEVQQWEEERQEEAGRRMAEQLLHQAQQEEREREELAQEHRDEALFEQHRASQYRDWEQWVVLNSPTIPKRRRLLITAGSAAGQQEVTPMSAALTLPHGADRLDTLQVTFRVEVEPDLPDKKAMAGDLDDRGVVSIFGDEWLFLFQVNKEGLEGETLASGDAQRPVEQAEEGFTQLDSDQVGQSSMTGFTGAGPGVWGHELRAEVGKKQFQLTDSEEVVVHKE